MGVTPEQLADFMADEIKKQADLSGCYTGYYYNYEPNLNVSDAYTLRIDGSISLLDLAKGILELDRIAQ